MNRKTILLLLGVLIIAIFFRTFHLKTAPPGLYPDEAMDGSDALQVLHTHDLKVFYPENNGREGLFVDIQAAFLSITHVREPWVLRLPPVIFGILTVLGMFFLARELLEASDERRAMSDRSFSPDLAGLLAAFFLATSFWHINFSRIGFRAIAAPFFIVWAMYFFLRAVFQLDEKQNWKLAAVSGVFFALGFYTYIAYRAMPLLFLTFIPFFYREKRFWKMFSIFAVAAFIVILPLCIYFIHNPADLFGRTAQVSVTSSPHPVKDLGVNILKTIGMLDIKGDGNWRHNIAGRPELFWPVGIFFWIGMLSSIRKLIKRSSEIGNWKLEIGNYLLIAWLILAALPAVLSNESVPHALRSILLLPPIMLLAAYGAAKTYAWLQARAQYEKQKRYLLLAAALLLAFITFNAYRSYFTEWARTPIVAEAFNQNYVDIGNEIRSLPQSEPKYVFVDVGDTYTSIPDPWNGGRIHAIPVSAQTVMFLTDSYSPEEQLKKNIHYIVRGEDTTIPTGAAIFHVK